MPGDGREEARLTWDSYQCGLQDVHGLFCQASSVDSSQGGLCLSRLLRLRPRGEMALTLPGSGGQTSEQNAHQSNAAQNLALVECRICGSASRGRCFGRQGSRACQLVSLHGPRTVLLARLWSFQLDIFGIPSSLFAPVKGRAVWGIQAWTKDASDCLSAGHRAGTHPFSLALGPNQSPAPKHRSPSRTEPAPERSRPGSAGACQACRRKQDNRWADAAHGERVTLLLAVRAPGCPAGWRFVSSRFLRMSN